MVLNLGITDIRKRSISQRLVCQDDNFDESVIVKTDLNCGGIPESKIYDRPLPKRRSLMRFVKKSVRRTRNAGIKLNLINTHSSRFVETEYRESFRIFEHKDLVPKYIWNDEDWIVE